MKKIPTLFKRDFVNHQVSRCYNEVTPGLEYVLEDPGVIPTVKHDGSCCRIVFDPHTQLPILYKRYDAKKGRKIPFGAVSCQPEPDPVTGHWPHWIRTNPADPGDKWFIEALSNYVYYYGYICADDEGTYEAVGPHFQGNPYNLEHDKLIRHGSIPIKDLRMSYEGIREWLETNQQEGIVFWYDGEPVCKIKRSDFGLSWPIKEEMRL